MAMTICGEKLRPVSGKYANGREAIQLVCLDGEPYCSVTVNVPEWQGKPGQVLAKTWSENAEIFDQLVWCGFLKPTGETVQCGYAVAAVCDVEWPTNERR